MEHFGHFFEFFAALNSAYIVSNHFIESLITKVNNHFKRIDEDLNLLHKLQKNNYERLIKEGENCVGMANAEMIAKNLSDQNENISHRINALEQTIETAKKKNAVNNNFNYQCLFGALYCILILVLNGFEFDFKTPFQRQSLLLFNFISIIILLILFRGGKSWIFKKLTPSYNNVMLIFFVSVALAFPIFYLLQMWLPLTCYYDFSYVDIGVSILIPTWHFVYYSITSSRRTKRQSNNFKETSRLLKEECERFAGKMQAQFEAVNLMIRPPDNQQGEGNENGQ